MIIGRKAIIPLILVADGDRFEKQMSLNSLSPTTSTLMATAAVVAAEE